LGCSYNLAFVFQLGITCWFIDEFFVLKYDTDKS